MKTTCLRNLLFSLLAGILSVLSALSSATAPNIKETHDMTESARSRLTMFDNEQNKPCFQCKNNCVYSGF